ncbi:MAG: TlpA family protein disulfide reductase [Prevotella sp.]|nr:TlpA family protein disulfide reductase [Prevotella sp.]
MMKNVFKKISIMLVGAAFVLPSQAQLLKVTAKDKALQKATFINHGEFINMEFDEKGVWTYNNTDKVKAPTEVNMMLLNQGGFVPVLLEPGKTAYVEFALKKGKLNPKYSGDNVQESRYLFESTLLTPERYAPREFDPDDFEDLSEEELQEMKANVEKLKRDTITFDEAYRRLDLHYAATKKAANAVKDVNRRNDYLHHTELRYLSSLLDLTETKAHAWKMDLKKDAYYKELLGRINPNDELGVDQLYRLPQRLLESKLTTNMRDVDQTAYALDYINNVDKTFTNETIRHRLLSDLGMHVFNASYSGQVFEMDKFWEAFKKASPKRTFDYFQPIYESRKATKAGQPCPDVSFSDPQGNPHKLSEYFGKVLYIDIWATWCGPCCAEIPYIEKHVAHYKDNPKIQFISISIDSNKQAWHNKLEKDKPEWLQFLCNKQEYELISKQWGITGIPRFVIINADGTINNSEAFRPSAYDFRERIDKIIGE